MRNQQTAIVLGYLRIWQIVGDRKRGIEPILPVGRSTFLAGVKSGKYPKPVKLVDEFLRVRRQLDRQAKERETLAYQVARLSGKDS